VLDKDKTEQFVFEKGFQLVDRILVDRCLRRRSRRAFDDSFCNFHNGPAERLSGLVSLVQISIRPGPVLCPGSARFASWMAYDYSLATITEQFDFVSVVDLIDLLIAHFVSSRAKAK